jgi:predicted RNA-binding Zn ribbon-like protein
MKRDPALFIADAKALDFLNSIATPVDVPIDWLEDGEGLVNWVHQAELVDDAHLKILRGYEATGELDRVAKEARQLREWFRAFVTKHRGRALTPHALKQLEPLNRLLERDASFGQIEPATDPAHAFELRTSRRWSSAETLLLPIAEALARFICTEDFAQVKACEGPSCTLLFADHTRSHRRRWCSMAICGNRAKQAAHRDRNRTEK